MKKDYRVLSGVKSVVIVEGRNLSKSQANKLSNKIKGVYCGISENGNHKKIRGNKFIKRMHCERVKTKIIS